MRTIKQIKVDLALEIGPRVATPVECALQDLLDLLDRPESGVKGKDAPPPERLTRAKIREVFAEWWSGYCLDPSFGYPPEEKEDHMAEAFIGGVEWALEQEKTSQIAPELREMTIEDADRLSRIMRAAATTEPQSQWRTDEPSPEFKTVFAVFMNMPVVAGRFQEGWRVLVLGRDGFFSIHGNFEPFGLGQWMPIPAIPPSPSP